MNSFRHRVAQRTNAAHLLLLIAMVAVMLIATACTGPSLRSTEQAQAVSADKPAAVETAVVRVIDGDTVAVVPVNGQLASTDDQMTETTVRLLGIQAPEMNYHAAVEPECMAEAATEHLEHLLPEGTAVTLHFDEHADTRDKYGRALGYLELGDGTDAAENLASYGLVQAWYPDTEPTPERFEHYSQLTAQAAQDQRGLHGRC